MLEAAVSPHHDVVLPTGRLRVEIDRMDWPLSRLFCSAQQSQTRLLVCQQSAGKTLAQQAR
jgi:hypothetical protein